MIVLWLGRLNLLVYTDSPISSRKEGYIEARQNACHTNFTTLNLFLPRTVNECSLT